MQQALHRSSLVPRGFVVESAYHEGDKAIVVVRASGSVGLCPSCGTVSRRVHSRYRRCVTDLPLSGRIVQLLVIARRFRCDAVLCGRQISPSALRKAPWHHRRAARRGWTRSFITSAWRRGVGWARAGAGPSLGFLSRGVRA